MCPTQLTLDEIGLEFNTDKSSAGHDYLVLYERFFGKWRHDPIRLLEIGVFEGASVKTWEKYFTNATIIGADIDVAAERFATRRTKIKIIDQSNLQDLVNLGVAYGPFDIVIEDGSHFWEHQITTLRTIFPFVKEGGYYVAEDLQTNFGEPHYRGVSSITCVEYLKKLLDLRVADEQIDIKQQEDAFLRTYGNAIELMVFSRHACLIEKAGKKNPRSSRAFITTPLVNVHDREISHVLQITGHLRSFGDVENNSAPFINVEEGRDIFIEGFRLTVASDLTEQIRYRARLSNGLWTEWVAGNNFVGSRGRGDSLTGFAVGLAGELQRTHDVEVIGAFAGDTEPVIARNGQDCLPRTPYQPLRGMQIILSPKQ